MEMGVDLSPCVTYSPFYPVGILFCPDLMQCVWPCPLSFSFSFFIFLFLFLSPLQSRLWLIPDGNLVLRSMIVKNREVIPNFHRRAHFLGEWLYIQWQKISPYHNRIILVSGPSRTDWATSCTNVIQNCERVRTKWYKSEIKKERKCSWRECVDRGYRHL